MKVKERYKRNLNALSKEDMEILESKKICIIGLGGLGGYILEYLIRIGIKNILIIDKDKFEISNLNRQILSLEDNIGKNKVSEGIIRAKKIDRNVNIRGISTEITKENIDIIEDPDVIIDGLDNVTTRLIIAEYAKKINKPFVHGAIEGWRGQVSVAYPKDDTLSILYKEKKKVNFENGNLSFLAGMTASIESSEVVKILLDKENIISGRILIFDLLYNTYKVLKI